VKAHPGYAIGGPQMALMGAEGRVAGLHAERRRKGGREYRTRNKEGRMMREELAADGGQLAVE